MRTMRRSRRLTIVEMDLRQAGGDAARSHVSASYARRANDGAEPRHAGAAPFQSLRGSEETVLLENVVGAVLVDQHGRQGDHRLELLPVEQLDRLSQPLRARRRIKERRREEALVDPSHPLVGQPVDAEDELDVLVAPGVLGGEIGAISHRIVVPVDEVDLLVVAQRRRHDVVGLVLLPVARLVVEQILDARLPCR